MTAEPLAIAQVSPFALEASTEVGGYVQRISAELASRGHRLLIVAPSQSPALIREGRRMLREPGKLLARADGSPLVLAVGEVLPFSPARRRSASIPVDVARAIEQALGTLALDVAHVHEPFAPSAASIALRNSHALNVGSFHAPTDRILSTQLAAPLTRLLFSRLDARTASYEATRALLNRYFPGEYEVITPGLDPAPPRTSPPPDAPLRLLFVADEERGALRTFLRALRALPTDSWTASVWSSRRLTVPASLGRTLRDRVAFLSVEDHPEPAVMADHDVLVLASEGDRVLPGTLLRGLGAGLVPVASRLVAYEELLDEGRRGLLFEPRDTETLSAQLRRLIGDRDEVQSLRTAADSLRDDLRWDRVAERIHEIYLRLVARRHDDRDLPTVRRRLARRNLIDVDLHMHTDHSHDCATPVEVLLAEAEERGLGAIAVTDHNEVSGALEAAGKTSGALKVIVGEEVKTADQGEVIGLFVQEKIPRGMTLQQTITEIKRQGGIVYVPHPFDRLHSVPDYEHMLDVLDDIDAVEVFNPRIAINEFNEEAVRFAAKYRIPGGAGSDAHVPQGLGSVRIRMRDFDGPEEFLQSLRDADIIRNPASLLYVQALKFLQTRAMPEAARRASRDRRVRRATRKS